MRAAGLRVWQDDTEMGLDLQASMSEGIAKSDVVVVLASPDYARSASCMFELRTAAAAGKPLVACCVEPGFWRTWGLAADGSGVRALPDDHELVTLARFNSQLFVDLGAAAAVNWASDSVPPAERKKLALPEALPRLLELLAEARKAGGRDEKGATAAVAAVATRMTRNSAAFDELPASAAASASLALLTLADSFCSGPTARTAIEEARSNLSVSSVAPEDASAPVPAGAAGAVPVAATVWTRHRDGTDVWFVSAARESVWELPTGAIAVDAAPEPAPSQLTEMAAAAAAASDAAAEEQAASGTEPAKRKRLKGKVVRRTVDEAAAAAAAAAAARS